MRRTRYLTTHRGLALMLGVTAAAAVAGVLVGVEAEPFDRQDRPSLFGVAFDGPMPGHEPGMPVKYDLRAWIWKHNPDGVFAPWNPRVSCPS